MENLKKCPFCGGQAKLYADLFMTSFWVECNTCGCKNQKRAHSDEIAINIWNNRATEAELRANVIDEFAEAIMVKATELSEKVVFDGKLVGDALSLDCVSDMVLEIASKMKGEKE